jgi:hypothetical protein
MTLVDTKLIFRNGQGRALFSVVDPDHFDPDPNPAFQFDTDPDPTFQFDTDPDPNFHFDTDPDPYCFKEVMYVKRYGTFY